MRTGKAQNLADLAANASVPVINGLTDDSHPCQVMADVMTFEEKRGPIRGRKLAWVGDGNNMATSLIHAAVQFGFRLDLACPAELQPSPKVLQWAAERQGQINVTADPALAAADADCLITDTWVSMGMKDAERRHRILAPYQVNAALMQKAAKDAIFMHCLPAHRGEEVTADVIDGPQSVVFDEAENRLHAQKAILAWCFGA
jgi:ornithine carbamoyltransferase